MTVLGAAIRRSWGECAWTARDLLTQRVPVAGDGGLSIVVHPREPDPPRVILVPVHRVPWR